MISEAADEIERRKNQAPRQDDAHDSEAKEIMRIKMICEVAHGSAETVREGRQRTALKR